MKIIHLPSQALLGNEYGTVDWRRIRRQARLREERESERRRLRLDAMQDAFGPDWPKMPPGAAEDPSLI